MEEGVLVFFEFFCERLHIGKTVMLPIIVIQIPSILFKTVREEGMCFKNDILLYLVLIRMYIYNGICT